MAAPKAAVVTLRVISRLRRVRVLSAVWTVEVDHELAEGTCPREHLRIDTRTILQR
jgi:hypothetical protein